MKKVLLIIASLLFMITSDAQPFRRVSGYLGKRLAVGVGADLSASRHPQNKEDDGALLFSRVNRTYTLNLEYTTGSYFNLGVQATYAITSMNMNFEGDKLTWTDSMGSNRMVGSEGRPDIRYRGIGMYGKYFFRKKAALAPVGMYFTFGANIYNMRYDLDEVLFKIETISSSGGRLYNDIYLENTEGTEMYIGAHIGLGKSVPLFNVLMFDFAVKMGYTGVLAGSSPIGLATVKSAKQEIDKRIRGMNLLNCSFKLYMLL